MGNRYATAAAVAILLFAPSATSAQDSRRSSAEIFGRPDQARFLSLFRELVETNTQSSNGSCTLAAQRMAARLRAAGFDHDATTIFIPEGRPREGGLLAKLEGHDPGAPAILLLAHIDVVEARKEDWRSDPYVLTEQNGYYYGRGVIDDKAQAAIWVDALIRLQETGLRPRRTIKVALTCGEESGPVVNGAQWLMQNMRQAADAGFALNEGGGGQLDAAGAPIQLSLQVGEKSAWTFQLETTNPGGHSSRPTPENAIYEISAALAHISDLRFAITFTDTSRAYFQHVGTRVSGDMGAAIQRLVDDPQDVAAAEIVTGNPTYNAMLRTTCVATTIEGGHAINALPQTVKATVNCRLLPGDSPEAVEKTLKTAIGDPRVFLTRLGNADRPLATPPALTPEILDPARSVAATRFPGVPVVPTLLIAGTDAVHLSAAGIPTYGVPGLFIEMDGNGAHGRDERIGIRALYEGRDYIYDLLRLYADQP